MLPVCIPSYKNREITKKLFSQLSTFDDVYLFVYDFDYKESGYDKLELPSNVKVVQINIDRDFKKYGVNRTDLSTKRCFIFDYMTSLGIDTYISIDDDCGDQHFIKDKNNVSTKLELVDFIEEIYKRIKQWESKGKEWCIVSPRIIVYKPKKFIEKYREDMMIYDFAWEGSVMFINRKILAENGVKHVPLTASDIAFNIKCLHNGLLPLVTSFLYTNAYETDKHHSTLSEKHRKEIMFTFKEYPNDVNIDYFYNTKELFVDNNSYISILNKEENKMPKNYKELYEFALKEDVENFMKKAYEIVGKKHHNKKIIVDNKNNQEW